MEKFINLHLNEIETQILKIEQNEKNKLKCLVDILKFLELKIVEIKEFIVNYEFQSESEEILFFKEQKPKIWK